MTDQYYIKKGRRYVPVDLFTGFPADGIWLVKRTNYGHSEQLMIALADLKDMRSVEDIVRRTLTTKLIEDALIKVLKSGDKMSYADIAKAITKELQRQQE